MNGRNASRFISLDSSDLLIEALVAEKNHADAFHRISFKASVIDHLFDVTEKISAIALKSNIIIAVALPFKELQSAIYEPDFKNGTFLDLTPLTGQAVKDTLVPKLAETFNTAADDDTPHAFQITVYAKDSWGNRKPLTFPSDYIDYIEYDSDDMRQSVIYFKDDFNIEEMESLQVNVPIDILTEALETAKNERQARLNLMPLCTGKTHDLPPAAKCKRYVP